MLTIPMYLRFEVETSQATKLNMRKKINNKEELREQLEKLQVEMGTSKVLRISLDEQLFTEEKLRKFVEQQLMEKDKEVMSLDKSLKGRKGG